MLNAPIGDYDQNAIANIAFNRWASDLSLAATWLDPEIGLDISGVADFTFNGKNLNTNYRTGQNSILKELFSRRLHRSFRSALVVIITSRLQTISLILVSILVDFAAV